MKNFFYASITLILFVPQPGIANGKAPVLLSIDTPAASLSRVSNDSGIRTEEYVNRQGILSTTQWPLILTISAAVVLIMSGLILFDTSRIINGGETNYIRATVSLYLNIYNLFIHLLHLITALSGND